MAATIDDERRLAYAKNSYETTCALHEATKPVRLALAALAGSRTELQNELAAAYYRIFFWMESIVRLKEPTDAQAILHGVRCIYELRFDIIDLINDQTLFDRYKAFGLVSPFAAAIKLIEAIDRHGFQDIPSDAFQRQFIADAGNKSRYDSLCSTLWTANAAGKIIAPIRWHQLNLAQRAKAHGKDEEIRYRRMYASLCSYSHAGPVIMSPSSILTAFSMGNQFAQSLYIEATNIIGQHFGLFDANPKLLEPFNDYVRANSASLKALLEKYPIPDGDTK